MSIVVLVILVYGQLLFVLERIRPYRPWPHGRVIARVSAEAPRIVTNLALALINGAIGRVVIGYIVIFSAARTLTWRPPWLTEDASLCVSLLVLDAWIYFWHRTVHALPLTWRFHQVHHQDRTLDVTSALRFHIGDVIISAVSRAGVVILFDIPMLHVFVFECATLFVSMFHHSALKLPPRVERLIALVIVTPSIHWVHHHQDRDIHDSNFGTMLSLWDRVFGTLSASTREPAMPLGLRDVPDEGAFALLLRPLRSGRRDAPAAAPSQRSVGG